ncbi:hypothetical protein GCM10010278_28690 [Streptomyces melanogenes]|nr:hypothetical protein GCM10010278_28690 [Streptomyces melanogenes]
MSTAPDNDATARVSGSLRRKAKNSASAGAAIKKNSANGARSGESSGMYASTAPAPDTASTAPAATAVRSARADDLSCRGPRGADGVRATLNPPRGERGFNVAHPRRAVKARGVQVNFRTPKVN